LVSVANAGVTKTALAAAAARSAARRDSRSEFPPGLCHPVFTLHCDYRASQLSETASNFSHCCEVPSNYLSAAADLTALRSTHIDARIQFEPIAWRAVRVDRQPRCWGYEWPAKSAAEHASVEDSSVVPANAASACRRSRVLEHSRRVVVRSY